MRDRILIVNNKDKHLKRIKNTIKVDTKKLNIKNIKYGFVQEIDIEDVHFVFNSFKHLLSDVYIAIKVGLLFNIELKLISEAISEYKSSNNRLEIIDSEYKIIDDSYNSSYESLIGGLNILKNIEEKKYIVLGDMLELGKYSIKYHKKVNKYLKKIKNKEILLIGNYTKYINGKYFNNIDEIISYLKNNLLKGNIVYIKGSRKFNLDKIKTRI